MDALGDEDADREAKGVNASRAVENKCE